MPDATSYQSSHNGVTYQIEGTPGAPPLVLLSSLGTTAALWAPQLQALRPWFSIVAIEHPGHGGSSVPPGEGSISELARRVQELLDSLNIARASFAGVSLGGLVALWLAAKDPPRVERVVVSCATAKFDNADAYKVRAGVVRREGTAAITANVISRWFSEPFVREHPEVANGFADMLSGVEPAGYAYCAEAVASADLRHELAGVTAACLVVAGALDPVVPPDLAMSTATAIPGAAFTVLPGAAHLANVEKAPAFNELLISHLLGSQAERGARVRRTVLGEDHVDRAVRGASTLTADFQEMLSRWPWGEVWARPGLDLRTRRLLTIALLTALNRHDELEIHVRRAFMGGMSEEDVKEVLLHTAVYAGIPAANAAFSVADRVGREALGRGAGRGGEGH